MMVACPGWWPGDVEGETNPRGCLWKPVSVRPRAAVTPRRVLGGSGTDVSDRRKVAKGGGLVGQIGSCAVELL